MNHLLAMIFSVFFFFQIQAQQTYRYSSGELSIEGTSSLHDWDISAGIISINSLASISSNESPLFNNLDLKVKVSSLKSEKGKIMDNKTHVALKEKEHPYIYFSLKEIQSVQNAGDHFLIKATGNLNIAGEEKVIDLDVKVSVLNNGSIQIQGKKELKMTSFNIDPPTALLGTLKTGDDISILFNVNLSNSNL